MRFARERARRGAIHPRAPRTVLVHGAVRESPRGAVRGLAARRVDAEREVEGHESGNSRARSCRAAAQHAFSMQVHGHYRSSPLPVAGKGLAARVMLRPERNNPSPNVDWFLAAIRTPLLPTTINACRGVTAMQRVGGDDHGLAVRRIQGQRTSLYCFSAK